MPSTPAGGPMLEARRTRAFAAIARARIGNAWLRFAASAIAACLSAAMFDTLLPLLWLAGLVLVVAADRAAHMRVLALCEASSPPKRIGALVAWTAFQAAYGNSLAVVLWFTPYASGQTLAVIFLCASLTNAAATLRQSAAMSIAAVSSALGLLLCLPIAEFLLAGARDTQYLVPTIGALLLMAWGVKLWQSLVASDVAQASAEAAFIRERQAEAAAAAAKTDMIARMNDELRTPMKALAGAGEHLRRTAATPQARAHVASIVQAGDVLKLVLDDLSDLGQLESGGRPIAVMSADPRELLRGVVGAFRAAAHDKHLELFMDTSALTPPLVEMDALRVRQVLFDLLANAIHCTAYGGVRVLLQAQPANQEGRVRLTFSIADTGAGLSRSKLALIFRGGGDGGFGLARSVGLAKLMGGKITATSELGQGSVFSLVLDAAVAAADQARAVPEKCEAVFGQEPLSL